MTASTVRFCRTDPAASPAVLVAAWLIDALAGTHGVTLNSSEAELIMLDVTAELQAPVRTIVHSALTEARFAGWELALE